MLLTQESLEKSKSIQKLEEAAADLYKALQAGRDRGPEKIRHRLVHQQRFSHHCFQTWLPGWNDSQNTRRTILSSARGFWTSYPSCSLLRYSFPLSKFTVEVDLVPPRDSVEDAPR